MGALNQRVAQASHRLTSYLRLPAPRAATSTRPSRNHAVSCHARAAGVAVPVKELQFVTDSTGMQRVVYDREGWNFYTTAAGFKAHYVVAGPEDAPPLVLVHGYGASAFHWRYNIPALSKRFRVYAVCLLGFGYSQKAVTDYSNGRVWVAQLSEFVEKVVGGKPVVLAGNSLGGYASLATAAARPDLVRGVVLLNGAGPFTRPGEPVPDPDRPPTLKERLMLLVSGVVKRVMLFFAFIQAKQPGRIRGVLEMVYVNKEQIDDDLVDSIVQPAKDPLAPEVFFRLNHSTRPPLTVNVLLARMKAPLLLLWGMKDPWIIPARAAAVRELYPSAKFVPVSNAGHCPHDDCPAEVNAALADWMTGLPAVPEAVEQPATLSAVAARLRSTI